MYVSVYSSVLSSREILLRDSLDIFDYWFQCKTQRIAIVNNMEGNQMPLVLTIHCLLFYHLVEYCEKCSTIRQKVVQNSIYLEFWSIWNSDTFVNWTKCLNYLSTVFLYFFFHFILFAKAPFCNENVHDLKLRNMIQRLYFNLNARTILFHNLEFWGIWNSDTFVNWTYIYGT
jgi:hypothetical protein